MDTYGHLFPSAEPELPDLLDARTEPPTPESFRRGAAVVSRASIEHLFGAIPTDAPTSLSRRQ